MKTARGILDPNLYLEAVEQWSKPWLVASYKGFFYPATVYRDYNLQLEGSLLMSQGFWSLLSCLVLRPPCANLFQSGRIGASLWWSPVCWQRSTKKPHEPRFQRCCFHPFFLIKSERKGRDGNGDMSKCVGFYFKSFEDVWKGGMQYLFLVPWKGIHWFLLCPCCPFVWERQVGC